MGFAQGSEVRDLCGKSRQLFGRSVGEQDIPQEQIAGAQQLSVSRKKRTSSSQVNEVKAEVYRAAGSVHELRQHGVARQLVEVSMHRQDGNRGKRFDGVLVARR